MNRSKIPIVRGRFLVPMLSHMAFFIVIATRLLDRTIAIPLYMFVAFGLSCGLGWFEGVRIGPFLKQWYPSEFEKLRTRSGYGYNSLLSLRFAFTSSVGDDRRLRQVRQRTRWAWIEAFSMPPLMFVVTVSAVTVSKHYG